LLGTRGMMVSGDDGNDFGLIMERLLRVDSIKWFGVEVPLRESAGGPFTGINFNCLRRAEGLSVLEESHATHPQNDQIALWPSDKFVPDLPYSSGIPITNLSQSPLTSGKIYGMRLGTRESNTDFGQGSETGKGIWILIDDLVKLRDVAPLHGLTGYYRPEDYGS
jgi:hypothetical protein